MTSQKITTAVPDDPDGSQLDRDSVAGLPTSGPVAARPRRLTAGHVARQLLARGSLIGIWALMIAAFGIGLGGKFLQSGTFQTIFSSPVHLIFLCLALVVTFCVGEFDLSVASVMGISGTLVSVLTVREGFNPWVATLVALVAAAVIGALNGVLIVIVGVNAIVVTLGVGTALTGIALWVTNLNTISGLPASFSTTVNFGVGGVAISFFYGLALTLVLAYILTSTPLGLRMSFVGANHEVARLAGVRVKRIRLGSYIASGVISGLGGVVLAATLGGFDPTSSPNYLLPAFAAVFLGVQRPRRIRRHLLPTDRDRRAATRRADRVHRGSLLRRHAGRRRDHLDHRAATDRSIGVDAPVPTAPEPQERCGAGPLHQVAAAMVPAADPVTRRRPGTRCATAVREAPVAYGPAGSDVSSLSSSESAG